MSGALWGVILWALLVYVHGASLRRTAHQIGEYIRRSHGAVWDWIHKFRPLFESLFAKQELPDRLIFVVG